jgi:hypothetical protein
VEKAKEAGPTTKLDYVRAIRRKREESERLDKREKKRQKVELTKKSAVWKRIEDEESEGDEENKIEDKKLSVQEQKPRRK